MRHDRDSVDWARLVDCPRDHWIVPEIDWRGDALSTSYFNWRDSRELTPEVWIIPQYCGGSDYSGSIIERSNHRALLELCKSAWPDGDGTDFIRYCGGHGTFDLAIRAESLLTRDPDTRTDEEETSDWWRLQIVEAMEALSDYHLIDESLHSEMEVEAQNEAWDDWARRDFQRELGEYIAKQIRERLEAPYDDAIPLLSTLGCSYDLADFVEEDSDTWCDDRFADSIFYDMAELANEYWINEEGDSCWINVSRVISNSLGAPSPHWGDWSKAKRREVQGVILARIEEAYCEAFYARYAQHV